MSCTPWQSVQTATRTSPLGQAEPMLGGLVDRVLIDRQVVRAHLLEVRVATGARGWNTQLRSASGLVACTPVGGNLVDACRVAAVTADATDSLGGVNAPLELHSLRSGGRRRTSLQPEGSTHQHCWQQPSTPAATASRSIRSDEPAHQATCAPKKV